MSNELTCRYYHSRLCCYRRGLDSRFGIGVIRDSYVVCLLDSLINGILLANESGNRNIVDSHGCNGLESNLFCNLCNILRLRNRLGVCHLGSDLLSRNLGNRDSVEFSRLNSFSIRNICGLDVGLTYLLCDVIARKCRNLNVINLCRLESLVNYRFSRCGKHNRIEVINNDLPFDNLFVKLNIEILIYNCRIYNYGLKSG